MSYPDSHHSYRFIDFIDDPSLVLPSIKGLEGLLVPTIERAIQPLKKVLKGADKMLDEVSRNARLDSMKTLKKDEAAAILLYTLEWNPREESLYHILNKTLSSRDRDRKLEPWLLFLRLLLVALSKLPLVENTTVYRGIPSLADYSGKQEVTWYSFTSTSSDEQVARGFCSKKGDASTLFVIRVRSGRDLSGLSIYPQEKEVLLPLIKYFEIQKRDKDAEGLTIVHLREKEASNGSIMPKLLSYDDKSLLDDDLSHIVQEAIEQQCTDLQLSKNNITSAGVPHLVRCLKENNRVSDPRETTELFVNNGNFHLRHWFFLICLSIISVIKVFVNF